MDYLQLISTCSGLVGTLLIFFFGIPPRIDQNGAIYRVVSEKDPVEIRKAKIYKIIGNIGLIFLIFSFLTQLISQLPNNAWAFKFFDVIKITHLK